MQKSFLLFLFILAVLFIHLATAMAENDLPIGVLASISDEWASVGQAMINGAEIARDEVNAEGGIKGQKIKLLIEDSREANSGAKAVSAYQSLRQRGIRYFIGPTGTPAGMSLAPIVGRELVVIITPMVGVREFSDSAPNIFNVRGVDETGSRTMAKFAIDHEWRRAAVLSSQQPWEGAQGRAFRDEFLKLGGRIVDLEEPLPDANDLKTPITKILSAKPQVIFLSNSNRIPLACRQLTALGYHGAKLAALLDETLVKEAQGTLEGTIFAAFGRPSTEFQKKYQDRYGIMPELGGDTAYDAVIALAKALREATTLSPKDVGARLGSVRFKGASGEVAFGADRIAVRSLVTFEVVAGKIKEKL